METQIVVVNGKQRKSFKKFGQDYVRSYYDSPAGKLDFFRKKCDMLGKTDNDIINDLIDNFNRSCGWEDGSVRNAGSLYERKAQEHIKDAVKKTITREFPWIFSEN